MVEDGTERYWLRVPVKERGPERENTYHHLPTVGQMDPVSEETNRRVPVREERQVTVPVEEERQVGAPASEHSSRRGSQSVTQSLPDSVPPEIDSEGGEGGEPLAPREQERFSPTPIADMSGEVRRSVRQRRPRQMFTYQTLGEPSLQPHPAVSTVATLTSSPYIPAWTSYHIQPPTGFAPYIPSTYMPYSYAMPLLY